MKFLFRRNKNFIYLAIKYRDNNMGSCLSFETDDNQGNKKYYPNYQVKNSFVLSDELRENKYNKHYQNQQISTINPVQYTYQTNQYGKANSQPPQQSLIMQQQYQNHQINQINSINPMQYVYQTNQYSKANSQPPQPPPIIMQQQYQKPITNQQQIVNPDQYYYQRPPPYNPEYIAINH